MSKLSKEELQKSLGALKKLSKAQLFHTPSDSDPKEWAGTVTHDPVDSFEVSATEGGVDYDPEARRLVGDKLAKGHPLSDAEKALAMGKNPMPMLSKKVAKGAKLTEAEEHMVKGMMPAEPSEPGSGDSMEDAPASNAGSLKDVEDEPEAHVSKGLRSIKNETLSKGFEVSEFLAEFAKSFDLALQGVEARLQKSLKKVAEDVVSKSVNNWEAQGEFNKSLAEAIYGIGSQVVNSGELAATVATQAARAPKSQRPVGYVEKSFNHGSADSLEGLSKSFILNTLTDLAMDRKINSQAVIKFESTGEMSPDVRSAVESAVRGRK